MSVSRRVFLKRAAATVAASALGSSVDAAPRLEKLTERAVSLRVLQRKLAAHRNIRQAPFLLRHLCGLTEVAGYVLDPEHEDIVLFGATEPAHEPVYTEDFAVALRNAFGRYARREGQTLYYSYPGCSIDPDPEDVARLGRITPQVTELFANGQEERARALWLETCRQPQAVSVFGMPFDCHAARVCVMSDYLMKALSDAEVQVDVPPATPDGRGFQSLAFRRKRKMASALENGEPIGARSSLNRFWFLPGEQAYHVDEGIALIAKCTVDLETEAEMLTAQGRIVGTGRVERDASEWAADFTTHYQAIAAEQPIYVALEQQFRHVACAKLLAREAKSNSLPDLAVLLEGLRIPRVEVESALPGRGDLIALSRVTTTGRTITTHLATLQLCGGVTVEIEIEEPKRVDAVDQRRMVLAARTERNALYWDLPPGSTRS